MPSYYKCCRRSRRRAEVGENDNQNNLLADADEDQFESRNIPEGNYESPAVICKRMEATGDFL